MIVAGIPLAVPTNVVIMSVVQRAALDSVREDDVTAFRRAMRERTELARRARVAIVPGGGR